MRRSIALMITASLFTLLLILCIYRLMHEGFLRNLLLFALTSFFGGFMKEAFSDFVKMRREKKAKKNTPDHN